MTKDIGFSQAILYQVIANLVCVCIEIYTLVLIRLSSFIFSPPDFSAQLTDQHATGGAELRQPTEDHDYMHN